MCSSFGCLGSRSYCFAKDASGQLSKASASAPVPAPSSRRNWNGIAPPGRHLGALAAMLNWYRAFQRKDLPASTNCRIASRVLLIWGERDSYCVRDLAEASLRLCDNGRAEYVKNATHWVQHDEPERCRELLLEFLKGASVTRTHIFETGDGKSPASNSQ
jgi:pimeloyl-ACP methyl ester carboxylesterase